MISGTHYTALVTSLRSQDWDGVVRLVDNLVEQSVRDATQAMRQQMELAKPALAPMASRSLDVAFVVSATRAATVIYTVRLPVQILVIGANDIAAVALLVDGISVAQARNLAIVTLGLTINDERDHDKVLSAVVPAGSTVMIKTLDASGNAAAPSLIAQQEAYL